MKQFVQVLIVTVVVLLIMRFVPWYVTASFVGLLILLALALDPINKRRIHSHCAALGLQDIRVEVFSNHYGVHFVKDGQECYAKCAMKGFKLKWKGKSPEDF